MSRKRILINWMSPDWGRLKWFVIGRRRENRYFIPMRWMLGLILVLTPAAFADEQAQHTAFSEGRYSDAVTLATSSTSADAYAFAARSLLADAMSVDTYTPPQATIEAAERYARAAIAISPDHIEGRLQLAIALSLRARPLSLSEVRRTTFGEESKSLAMGVLRDDPNNPYAHGFMAVWHVEVRRRGGSIGASILGASVKKGRRHYQAAIAERAHDASIHWQYARALTGLNAKKYRSEIEAALSAAQTCATESELEALMQTRADTLSEALGSQTRKSVEALANKML